MLIAKKSELNIWFYFLLFSIYFVIGYIFIIKLNMNAGIWDFVFSADSPRVFDDLMGIFADHYRAKVHPFYIILCQPVTYLLKGIFISDEITVIIFQSVIGTLNTYILSKILKNIIQDNIIIYMLLIIYSFSFSSLIFTSITETYIVAALSMLITWFYVFYFCKHNKVIRFLDIFILIFLGLFAYGITLTNFYQYIIAFTYIVFISKNNGDERKRIFKNVIYVLGGIGLGIIFLTIFQSLIFPNIVTIWDVILGKVENEEILYMNFEFNRHKLFYVFNSFFTYPLISPSIINTGYILKFSSYPLYMIILQFLAFGIVIYFLVRSFVMKNEKKYILFPIFLSLLGNFILHFIYGSVMVFLFSQHWIFLIIILFAFGLKTIEYKKILYIFLGIYTTILVINNLYSVYRVIYEAQFRAGFIVVGGEEVLVILGYIGLALLICLNLMYWHCYRIKQIYILIALVFFVQLYSIKSVQIEGKKIINQNVDECTFQINGFEKQLIVSSNNLLVGNRFVPIIENYDGKFKKYNNMIYGESPTGYNFKVIAKANKLFLQDYKGKRLIYDLNEQRYRDQYFIFGMGCRDKYILYKNLDTEKYNLYNYTERKNIYSNIELLKLDSVEYLAEGKLSDGSLLIIHEDEKGIKIINDGTEKVFESDVYINIPEYINSKNRKLLRRLFNETMVNITKNGPVPNCITYENKVFFRDAAMVAMFLNETGNIGQIIPWIQNMDSIYDMQRVTVFEPDNLGQVLYLQSFLENPNEELISRVLEEAKRLRVEPGILQGDTDFSPKPIYQTAWLKFGMESLGMDSSEWVLPNDIIDPYRDLLWFYNSVELDNYREENDYYYDSSWQYINYARANFYNYDLSNIDEFNNEYPLTYENSQLFSRFFLENDINVGKYGLSAPHIWGASEMYMYYLSLEEKD